MNNDLPIETPTQSKIQNPQSTIHCITCSDEAVPARVVRVDEATGLALVALGDFTEEIDVSLVDAVAPEDLVLVHGGVALMRLDEGP